MLNEGTACLKNTILVPGEISSSCVSLWWYKASLKDTGWRTVNAFVSNSLFFPLGKIGC